MGMVDKTIFEARGAHGVSDSDYTFAMTTCCERVGVVDVELDDFYWNAETPSQCVSLLRDSDCPLCGASTWQLHRLESVTHVPEDWRWACDDRPRPGRRIIRSLAEHVDELTEYCRRVASPMPSWNGILILNLRDPSVSFDRGWIVGSASLIPLAAFAPRFETLLRAGFAWINLSVYGVYRDDLIVGIELPQDSTGVPPGRTAVNYSGPPRNLDGSPQWVLALTVAE